MTTKLPPPPPPKPANGTAKSQAAATAPPREWTVTSGRQKGADRTLIYGPGGIGKTSLAALAPNPIILDLEGGTKKLDVKRVEEPIDTWNDLRAVIASNALDSYDTVVIDTVTKAQELAEAHTLATVPHEKGHLVERLEAYGFGKGQAHAYETFLLLLQDCDGLIRRGKNVILIAHDCISDVPNPVGDDWIRYEPHLQAPKSGKNSTRNRVVQWADHVLFIGYDVVSLDGKGKGGGTRTIWTTERPDHIAKVRGRIENKVEDSMAFEVGNGSIWSQILGGAS